MTDYSYGVIYFGGRKVDFNSGIREAFIKTNEGIVPSFAREAVLKLAVEHFFSKQLKNGSYLVVTNGQGFIINGSKLRNASWKDLTRGFKEETEDEEMTLDL